METRPSERFEDSIPEIFEENYEYLRAESGQRISDFVRNEALLQIQMYYRKNFALIQKITDAEVKLTLPDQRTPKKKSRYTIEGVVDIVREGEEVWMYDLKSHDKLAIESNKDLYRQQLNVYAFIWKKLRGNELDNTAVISTALPLDLKEAIYANNEKRIQSEMERWEPVIPLGYSEDEIEKMISDFGSVVEAIEDNKFAPPPVQRLFEKEAGDRSVFGRRVCRNCDVRFSCESFREYVRQSDKGNQGLRQYLDDLGTEHTPEEFVEGNIRVDLDFES